MKKKGPLTWAELEAEGTHARRKPADYRRKRAEAPRPPPRAQEARQEAPAEAAGDDAELIAKAAGVGILALLGLASGKGPVAGVRKARFHMYNSARWLGNIQPWLELSPGKILHRYARRIVGAKAGRLFSWGRKWI
jgi:hypothetical protein